MSGPNIIVGVVLLLLGRRLFWLFVGAAGFIAGLIVSQELFVGQPDWLVLSVAILTGVIGAVLSVFLQKLAVAVAGFLTGGYVLMSLSLAMGNPSFAWPAFLIGGVLGAALVLILFDWALILLSSLAGAALVAQSTRADALISLIIFLIALVAGVAIQARQFTKSTNINSRSSAEGE